MIEGATSALPGRPKKPEHLPNTQENSVQKIICSIVGLAIMFGFGYLPALAPITPAGMTALGIFIGLVFLWTTVDVMWPLFPAMVIFGTVYKDLFPNSWQSVGIYEAAQQSFGNWVTLFILFCLVLCVALEECGIIRRIALWFLSTRFARKGPRAFSFSLLLSTLVIGMFLDATPTQSFMLSIAYELYDEMDYDAGEDWPKYMVMGITYTSAIAYAMTPIGHAIPLLILGILSGITGGVINFMAYMMICIPVGLILFLLVCGYIFFVIKPDTTKVAEYDLEKLDSIRPGKMDTREKRIAGVSLALVILWVVPGLLSLFAPQSAICAFFNRHSSLMPLVLAVGALGIIRADGRPLLELKHGFARVNWQPVVLLAGIMMSSSALSAAGTGINDFIKVNLFPLIDGFSPWMVIGLICVLSCVLTNFLANGAVGAVFTTAGAALAMEMGMNPLYVGVAVCFGANMAYLFPSSFVPVAVAYSSPWCGGKTMLKNGPVAMLLSCIVMVLLIYPLCTLVYGA